MGEGCWRDVGVLGGGRARGGGGCGRGGSGVVWGPGRRLRSAADVRVFGERKLDDGEVPTYRSIESAL